MKTRNRVVDQPTAPLMPTTRASTLRDGRMRGVDRSVWMYRKIPLGPVVEASSTDDGLRVAEPLMSAFENIASLTPTKVKRRIVARSDYRQVHVLLINVPRYFRPDWSSPIADYLHNQFGQGQQIVDRRVALLGVRLKDRTGGGGGLRETIDSITQVLISGETPLSDFDEDTERVSAALTRAGLLEPTSEDLALADAWWNHGRNADTPILPHTGHIHVFTDTEAVHDANAAGLDNCGSWPSIPGQHSVTFASVSEVDMPFIPAVDHRSWWVNSLLNAGALAVSVRALVEPPKVTRAELRRQRSAYIKDIREREEANKLSKAEQDEMLAQLKQVEDMYSRGDATPTLTNASIIAAINGKTRDVNESMPNWSPITLAEMTNRQENAHAEMMLCSNIRANPNLLDLPSQVVAFSALPSLSACGDDPASGAMLGMTENDRQPTYVSPEAASAGDSEPLMLVAGSTGAGKSMIMLNLGDQFARMGRSVITVDPKAGSDHSATVLAAGGQVASLDEISKADGILDPLRFSANPQVGVELAASMLLQINPWGSRKADMETALMKALNFGVSNGATSTGLALQLAAQSIELPRGLVSDVMDLAESSPLMRACVGVAPGTESLSVHKGWTLIKVGDSNLSLPDPTRPDAASSTERISLALIRMMVFGSAMALTQQGGGVVQLDEAWTFLGAGRNEVDRLGRIARSQNVLPMLFTQKVDDAVEAGLSGYISRGLILPLEKQQAIAACELFKIEPTPERIARLSAKATKGGHDGSTAPNWNSMRALRDPETKKVLRGTVAYYYDLAQRCIPVEMTLSEEFLALASTNPEDIARRKASAAGAKDTQAI